MDLETLHKKNKTVQGTILKFRADRRPVLLSLTVFLLQLLACWGLPHAAAMFAGLALLPLLGSCAIYNHHQQHHNAFNAALLNRLFELVLGIQTMVTPYAWVLHHNYGHHPNYLHQPPSAGDKPEDESRWARRDGSTMGRIEYTLNLMLRAPFDALRVGRRQPRQFSYFLLMLVPHVLLQLFLLWLNPWNWLAVFLLPSFCMLIYVYYLTYEHHSGLHTEDHHAASRNRVGRFYNFRTFNLGYHTAHHIRPYLHWSLLPAYHELIKDSIPPHCYVPCR